MTIKLNISDKILANCSGLFFRSFADIPSYPEHLLESSSLISATTSFTVEGRKKIEFLTLVIFSHGLTLEFLQILPAN